MKTPDRYPQNPISSIKSRKKLLRILSVFLSVLVLQLFTGCSYFKVKAVPETGPDQHLAWLKKFNEAQKFMVLHQSGRALHLQNARIDEANLELSGVPDALPPEHTYKKIPEIGKGYRYKKDRQSPLNEVHLYLNSDVSLILGEQVTIPISSIYKMGYSDKNAGRSVLNVAGTVVGTFVLLLMIVALTKSSCPFLYVDDGENLVFQGELYPGNIIENAQKTDYLRLPDIRPNKDGYTLEITNELLEIQHTDEAVLEVVDHPAHVQVMMDPSGAVYSIAAPIAPRRAVADSKYDITHSVAETDGSYAAFDTPNTGSDGVRSQELWFDHEAGNPEGKLLLSLKNSYWLDYAMGAFHQKFGSYYKEYQEEQQAIPLERADTWRSAQNLPLSVYIATENGWEKQHEINAVGPMSVRELVLPLDLSEVAGEHLKIRLETGFMFWEIDRVALDQSPDDMLIKTRLEPITAMDNYGENKVDLMTRRDQRYYVQEEAGDWVRLQYESPPMQDAARTVFLRNTGYYTYIRDYSGWPDIEELKKFRNPGHFTRFAEEQYHTLIEAFIAQKPGLVAQDEAN